VIKNIATSITIIEKIDIFLILYLILYLLLQKLNLIGIFNLETSEIKDDDFELMTNEEKSS